MLNDDEVEALLKKYHQLQMLSDDEITSLVSYFENILRIPAENIVSNYEINIVGARLIISGAAHYHGLFSKLETWRKINAN